MAKRLPYGRDMRSKRVLTTYYSSRLCNDKIEEFSGLMQNSFTVKNRTRIKK